ncbi:WW domain [Plasmopara halstedii]|uniref:WW domain n=1 Tax=Plasmopara halstedii TaxID=4781 RepID=A0A0P1ABK2_PLAHL|nr:WW domain [Plasmopara halstedii]CEG38298.1 WW domain [Plasmopara halstedii]|eukprot:XP_024574667.1 WW domain [Plasmopara halstedii]
MAPKAAERRQRELAAQKARAEALKHLAITGSGPSQRELLKQQQLRQKQTANTRSCLAQRRVLGAQSQEPSATDKFDPRLRDNTLHVLALRRARDLQQTQHVDQRTEVYHLEVKAPENQYSTPPMEWEKVENLASGNLYHWNERTNETLWEQPGNSEVQTKELADGWEALPDVTSGDIYYWNQKTNETTWIRPVASSVARVSLAQAIEAKAKLDNILKGSKNIGENISANDQLKLQNINKREVEDNYSEADSIYTYGHGQKRRKCLLMKLHILLDNELETDALMWLEDGLHFIVQQKKEIKLAQLLGLRVCSLHQVLEALNFDYAEEDHESYTVYRHQYFLRGNSNEIDQIIPAEKYLAMPNIAYSSELKPLEVRLSLADSRVQSCEVTIAPSHQLNKTIELRDASYYQEVAGFNVSMKENSWGDKVDFLDEWSNHDMNSPLWWSQRSDFSTICTDELSEMDTLSQISAYYE